jgi:hypothetical protein
MPHDGTHAGDPTVIRWASPLPLLLPGVVLAFVVSTLASGRVAHLLRVRRTVAWVLLMSAGVILAATLTPLRAGLSPDLPHPGSCDLSRIGFPSLDDLLRPGDVLGNIVMFFPLGFAIAVVPRSRRKAALLCAAFAFPFLIEGTQLVAVSLNRACESADVVDNLTGLVLGLGVGAVVARLVPALGRVATPGDVGASSP